MNDGISDTIHALKTALRGYDKAEVERFVRALAASVEDATQKAELAQQQVSSLSLTVQRLETENRQLRDHALGLQSRMAQAEHLASERGRALLGDAQSKAVAIIEQARQEADAIVRQAEDRAQTALHAAEAEHQRLRQQVATLLEKRDILVLRMQAILNEYRGILDAVTSDPPSPQEAAPTPFVGMTPTREVTARDLHTILTQLQQKDDVS